jgi:predicted cupin superfamily sugar epimerase
MQLFVPGGWWKASEIPEEDLQLSGRKPELRGKIGCLISEVVMPGWNIEQHKFIDEDKVGGPTGRSPVCG